MPDSVLDRIFKNTALTMASRNPNPSTFLVSSQPQGTQANPVGTQGTPVDLTDNVIPDISSKTTAFVSDEVTSPSNSIELARQIMRYAEPRGPGLVTKYEPPVPVGTTPEIDQRQVAAALQQKETERRQKMLAGAPQPPSFGKTPPVQDDTLKSFLNFDPNDLEAVKKKLAELGVDTADKNPQEALAKAAMDMGQAFSSPPLEAWGRYFAAQVMNAIDPNVPVYSYEEYLPEIPKIVQTAPNKFERRLVPGVGYQNFAKDVPELSQDIPLWGDTKITLGTRGLLEQFAQAPLWVIGIKGGGKVVKASATELKIALEKIAEKEAAGTALTKGEQTLKQVAKVFTDETGSVNFDDLSNGLKGKAPKPAPSTEIPVEPPKPVGQAPVPPAAGKINTPQVQVILKEYKDDIYLITAKAGKGKYEAIPDVVKALQKEGLTLQQAEDAVFAITDENAKSLMVAANRRIEQSATGIEKVGEDMWEITFADGKTELTGNPKAPQLVKEAIANRSIIPAEGFKPPVEPPKVPPVEPPKTPSALMPDVQDIDEAITVATEKTPIRKFGNLPIIKSITKLIGGKTATASKTAELAEAGRNVLMQEAETKVIVATSSLESLGKSSKVFKIKDGLISEGTLKGMTVGDVASNPTKYASQLTPEQSRWIEQWNALDDAKQALLERNGIKLNELSFEEGGRYADRIVYAKTDKEGNLIEAAFISGGPKGVGGKTTQEMTRIFKTEAEAIKEGFRYLPPEEALYHNTRAAYARVINKQYADWILDRIPWRTTEAFSLNKANTLLNTALKKLPIKPQSIEALKRDMPAIAKQVETALAETDWDKRYAMLKDIKTYLRTLEPTAKENLAFAVEKLTQRRKLAETAIDVIQRAKRGEVIPTGTLKAIKKIITDPDLAQKLSEGTKLKLADIIRAGEEAATYPKTLKVPTVGTLAKYKQLIKDAEDALRANPDSVPLQKQLKKYKQGLAFAKFRMGKGEPFEFSKSPMSVLKGPQLEALDEVLTALRGKSFETTTATGKKVTKYEGGLLRELAKQELEAKNLRSKVRAQALNPKFEEATVQAPAFAGRILTGPEAKETAKLIKGMLEPKYSEALGAINAVNSIGRLFALAGDASPFLIQLIFAPFSHPVAFAKAGGGFVRALFDPEFLANYITKRASIINKSRNLIIPKGGTTEFTEAMGRGGFLHRGPLKYAGKVLEPFTRGYEAALTVAGVETRASLDYLATTPARAAQIDAYANKFRGLFSSSKIGVGKIQRQLETAVTLAPQYNRSIAAILTDAFRGNLRGSLARKYLIRGAMGLAATTVAISLARNETWEQIVDHLDPGSDMFIGWEIGGQIVGPGSKFRSVLVLLAKSAQNPKDLFALSMENPAFRFVRGNLSPAVSTGYDLITGKNYIGDPTRDGMLSLTKTVIGENMIPSWVQQMVFEGDTSDIEGALIRGGAGFFGMRGYPQTPYQMLDVMRNVLSMKQYGMDWEELGREKGSLYQDKLMKANPQMQTLFDKAQLESRKMAAGNQVLWGKWTDEGKAIETKANDEIDKAISEFVQTSDGKIFREKVDSVSQDKRFDYDLRKNNNEYRVIEDYFAEPLDEKTKLEMNKNDLARKDYYTKLYGPDMYDEYGNFKFDEAEKREQQFANQYGQEALNYVKEYMGEKLEEMPPAYQQLKADRQTLKPYWEIQEKYGPDKDADHKTIYRVDNPEADAALNLWGYSSIANSPKGLEFLKQKVQELGIDPAKVPALEPEKTDPRVMWDRGLDFVPMYLRDYWYEKDGGWTNSKLKLSLDVIADAKEKDQIKIDQYEKANEWDREKYRSMNPDVDVALNIWGRVSTVKSQKALDMLKIKARELGIPYESLPISPEYKRAEATKKANEIRASRGVSPTQQTQPQTSTPAAPGGTSYNDILQYTRGR